MELLPHTEEIVYQKVSIFGGIITNKVRINDLELVSLDDLYKDNDPSERSVRGLANKEVVFKVRETDEYLMF